MITEHINPRWAQLHGDEISYYGSKFVPVKQPRRSLLHWLTGCGDMIVSDNTGYWHECPTCRRVSGFVEYGVR